MNYVINYIGFNVLQGAKYPKCVVYTVPIYQIGAFINAGYEFSDAEKEYLEQYLPLEYMKENFLWGGALAANQYEGAWNVDNNLCCGQRLTTVFKVSEKLFSV